MAPLIACFKTFTNHAERHIRWELISYLVCACSILLVASKLHTIHKQGRDRECKDRLEADATSCLLVLDVLGTNSQAAAHAARMLRALQSNERPGSSSTTKAIQTQYTEDDQMSMASMVSHFRKGGKQRAAATPHPLPLSPTHDLRTPMPILPSNVPPIAASQHPSDAFVLNEQWQEWPVDYFDSLMWSSQFVLPADFNEGIWEVPEDLGENRTAGQSDPDYHGHDPSF